MLIHAFSRINAAHQNIILLAVLTLIPFKSTSRLPLIKSVIVAYAVFNFYTTNVRNTSYNPSYILYHRSSQTLLFSNQLSFFFEGSLAAEELPIRSQWRISDCKMEREGGAVE